MGHYPYGEGDREGFADVGLPRNEESQKAHTVVQGG